MESVPVSSEAELKLFRPNLPAVALGLAVGHLMVKPAFSKLPFGEWSRILVGQINRKHYCFAMDARDQVQGFVGWALTTRAIAEDWVEGRRGLSFEDSLQGDCLVFNAWSANSFRVHRFLVEEVRKLAQDKDVMYFRRHYPDGTSRPVRLPVNQFVAGHIARKRDGIEPGVASAPAPTV